MPALEVADFPEHARDTLSLTRLHPLIQPRIIAQRRTVWELDQGNCRMRILKLSSLPNHLPCRLPKQYGFLSCRPWGRGIDPYNHMMIGWRIVAEHEQGGECACRRTALEASLAQPCDQVPGLLTEHFFA